MLVSQKNLCGELQNVNVCTIVLRFHLPTQCNRKTQGLDWENVCTCAVVLLFSRSAREKSTWMDWKNVCLCAVRIHFHVVEWNTPLMLWSIQT